MVLEPEFRVLSKDVNSVKVAKKMVLSGFDATAFAGAQASFVATTFDPPPSVFSQFFYPKDFFDAFNHQCDGKVTRSTKY